MVTHLLSKFGHLMSSGGHLVTCADPAGSPCCEINCLGCDYSTIEGSAPTVVIDGLAEGTGTAPIPGDCGYDVPPCDNCGDLNATYVLGFIGQTDEPSGPDTISCFWSVDGDAIECGVPAGCNPAETLGATVSLTMLFNYSGAAVTMSSGLALGFSVPSGYTGILVELDLYEEHSGSEDAASTSYYGSTVEGQFDCTGSIDLPYLGQAEVHTSPDTQICTAPAASITVNFP